MKSEAITGTAINSELVSCGMLRRHEAVETRLARSKTVGIAILDGVEKQLEILSSAAASASRIRRRPTQRETLIDHKDPSSQPVRSGLGLRSLTAIGALLIACVLIGWCASAVVQFFGETYKLTGTAAVNAVVDRIIGVESNGEINATSKTSSAAGAGQFIEDTWLDMIRVHRPDLAKARTKAETLDLRREPKIACEMTTRFAERNAALLKKRGLPVTPSTIYLAHFAGGQAPSRSSQRRKTRTPRLLWRRPMPLEGSNESKLSRPTRSSGISRWAILNAGRTERCTVLFLIS